MKLTMNQFDKVYFYLPKYNAYVLSYVLILNLSNILNYSKILRFESFKVPLKYQIEGTVFLNVLRCLRIN